jgi:signal transduction protein with GAF and PtsI domain
MAKSSITPLQKVSDDKLMSENIGSFIKDPNIIEANVKQIIDEKIDSVIGEVVEKSFRDSQAILREYHSSRSDQDKKISEIEDRISMATERMFCEGDVVRRSEFTKLQEIISPRGFSPGLDGRQYVLMEDFKLFEQSYNQNSRQIKQRLIDTAHQYSDNYDKMMLKIQDITDKLSTEIPKSSEEIERMQQLELNSVIDLSHSFVKEGEGTPSSSHDSTSFQRLMEQHKEKMNKENEEYMRIKEESFEIEKNRLLRNIMEANYKDEDGNDNLKMQSAMDISPIRVAPSPEQTQNGQLDRLIYPIPNSIQF